MEGLIYLVGPWLAGMGLYLGSYVLLVCLCRRWRPDDVEYWEQYPIMGLLFVVSAVSSTLFAPIERFPFFTVFGCAGACTAVAHVFCSTLLLCEAGTRTASAGQPMHPRSRAARYTCASCQAAVPDRMIECPCCAERVPASERSEQLLPVPASPHLGMSGQLPRPALICTAARISSQLQTLGTETKDGRLSREKRPSSFPD